MFTFPRPADWRLTGIAFVVFTLISVPAGLATGVFQLGFPDDLATLARTAAIALILPALFEELVFRGPLFWLATNESKYLLPAAAVSLALFILWHPLNGIFLMTEARSLFTDWRFLSLAGLLGLFATQLAIKTRSIWLPVIFHWLCVVGWKAFLGGTQFLG